MRGTAFQGEVFGPGEPLPAEWDRFVAGQRLIRAWEAAPFAAMSEAGHAPWAGLVHERGSPVALVRGRLVGAGGPAAAFEYRLMWPKGPGIVFAAGLDDRGRREVVLAFEHALARRLRWRCLAVLYRHLPPEEVRLVRGFGRVRITTPYPIAVLANRWDTMNDYELSLPRKTRHRLRAQYRQVERDPDLKIELTNGPVESAEASRLVTLTTRRHPRPPRLGGPPPEYFDALSGEGVWYLTYRDATGRMLGVSMVFDDGRWLTDSVWGGLDPHSEGRPHIYFHRYLRLIAHMIASSRAGIDMGRGMTEVKQRYGALLVPQFLVAGLR
jgi:hypothetical protein